MKKTLLFLGEEANEINIKKANLTNSKYIVFASHALINGEIDAAVHSLKDLPNDHLKELNIVAIPDREDPTDILYHPEGLSLDDLSPGSIVGTCSLRRTGQLKNLRKDIIVKDIQSIMKYIL